MGTRRSAEWTAGASLFSGRPDPVWPLPDAVARDLEQTWEALAVFAPDRPAPPAPPPLGYRGCFADDGRGRHWDAYGGAVTLRGPGGREVREDPAREFERRVLTSAPEGALPEAVLALAGLEP
jgi:hypothetical protein